MRVVQHDEPAAVEILAQQLAGFRSYPPLPRVFDENPGPIENIRVRGTYDVLDGLGSNARQPVNAHNQLAIGFGIVGGPAAESAESAKTVKACPTVISEAGK